MSHYVVTGGAGFIGSALVRALLANGKSVHVIDNLSTGKLENLEEVAGTSRFTGSISGITIKLRRSLQAPSVYSI